MTWANYRKNTFSFLIKITLSQPIKNMKFVLKLALKFSLKFAFLPWNLAGSTGAACYSPNENTMLPLLRHMVLGLLLPQNFHFPSGKHTHIIANEQSWRVHIEYALSSYYFIRSPCVIYVLRSECWCGSYNYQYSLTATLGYLTSSRV